MPITLSAKKSLRQAERNHKYNYAFKEKVKKSIKSYLTKPSQEGLNEVFSLVDKAVKVKVFHFNKGKRIKSRLSKKLTVKETKAPATKVAPKKATKKKTVAKKSKKMS